MWEYREVESPCRLLTSKKVPFDLLTNKCKSNYVHVKAGFIWKVSREWLLWTGHASGVSLRKKPQSPDVKASIRRNISHCCSRNFCRHYYKDNRIIVFLHFLWKDKPEKLLSSLVGCWLCVVDNLILRTF